MKKSLFLLAASSSFFLACTPNPSRRSAADVAKLCPDPDKPVFAGSCLQTSSDAVTTRDSTTAQESARRPSPTAEQSGTDAPEPSGTTPIAASAGPSGAAPDTAAVNPSGSASTTAPADQPAAQQETDARVEGIKILTSAIDQIAGKISEGSGGAQQQEQGSEAGQETDGKTYIVKFTTDTFVAIADNIVVKNCFLPANSEVEVKGEPSKVTQFSNLGVEQHVALDVVSVTVSGGAADTCGLKGKDFVYLSAHAGVTVKP
jgi:hypothetical protein